MRVRAFANIGLLNGASTPSPATTPQATCPKSARDPSISGPRGNVSSIWVSLVAVFVLIVGVTWAISNTGAPRRRIC